MKVSELREKTVSDLKTLLNQTLLEHVNLRMQASVSGEAAPAHVLRQLRKRIARVKTLLTEKAGQ